jgi:hypothetical protein
LLTGEVKEIGKRVRKEVRVQFTAETAKVAEISRVDFVVSAQSND